MGNSGDEVIATLFELSNVEEGNIYVEVENGRSKDLTKLFKWNQRDLEANRGRDD
jgi:hypothetical protein